MKILKRLTSFLLVVAFISSAFAGCGKNNNVKTIKFLNYKPELSKKYKKIAEAYEKEKGVKLIVESSDESNYEKQLSSKISTSEAPTIFEVNGPIGYANFKSYCEDLSKTKIYKHLIDKKLAISTKDGVFGIPYSIEGYGIIYNKKIMDKYFKLETRTTKYNSVEEIKSFDALKAVTEDIQAHKKELKIKGAFAITSLKSGEDWRWHTHLANISIYNEFKQKNIDLTSDDVKKIAFSQSDNYKNVFDLYINNSTTEPKNLGTKIINESIAEFAREECVMIQNGNWAWKQIEEVGGNLLVVKDVKFLPIFTGAQGEESQGLCIGAQNFLCINSKASAQEQKMAKDFLYWLFSSDMGKDFVTNTLGFVTPFDTFEKKEQTTDPLGIELITWMKKDKIQTIPWNFTLFPSQKFKDDFGSALLQYAQGKKSWEDVKEMFVSEWQSEWNANKTKK